jgi:Tfp pilus assembly protein PilW
MSITARDERGFTITELMVSTLVTLVVTGAALGTFQSSLRVNDSAAQLADANQNLRAGMNQMIRDIMQAGRIIGPEGVPVPTGGGAVPIVRPGPPGPAMSFDLTTSTNIPDITTGHDLGPEVNGETTDMVTILTIDPFMPVVTLAAGGVSADGGTVTLSAAHAWMAGSTSEDTPPIAVGDLVYFKGPNGNAVQTVTRRTSTQIMFDANDYFRFNQRTAPQGTVMQTAAGTPNNSAYTLFRLLMITYYVDDETTEGSPRLVRKVNNYEPQALAGVVEDLQLTYDVVDGVNNPTKLDTLPYTSTNLNPNVTFTSNQIRTVNIHAGVRSEQLTQPTGDFIRNHINTSVDVRSLASVDRYR